MDILRRLFWEEHGAGFSSYSAVPVIFGSHQGLTWIGVHDREEFHVFGPFDSGGFSHRISAAVREPDSVAERKALEEAAERLPQLHTGVIVRYALILYYALTGRKAGIEELYFEGERKAEHKEERKEEDSADTAVNLQNCWICEKELYDSVARGERIRFESSFKEYAKLDIRTVYAGDVLRNHKDLRLFFLGMITHAAMEGGLPAATAFSMQAHYTGQIENARDTVALQAINMELYEAFIEQVRRIRARSGGASRFVIQVEEYLRLHIYEELSLEELAAVFHYTPYYLSRKFHKESGMHIGECLQRERIRQAAFLLETGSVPVAAISELLHFSSPSHFTRRFREVYGVTPSQYRTQVPNPVSE